MTRHISWRLLTVGTVAAMALAGCGSSDDDTPAGTASASPTTAAPVKVEADGALKLGTLLPQTGNLAYLGPPEFAGVKVAIDEVNAAGGVLGKPVTKVDSDSGDASTDIASQSVDRLLSQKVDAIIGAASSGVSLTVIDKITRSGVVQFSPANTSPAFSTYKDNGLYFRDAPSDILQGRVLSDLMLEDGAQNVAIMALQDPYGTGLEGSIKKPVTGGGGQIVEKVIDDPKSPNFAADVAKIKAKNPDAIALIAFDETKKIIPEMVKQGIDMKTVYFVDGNLADYTKDFPKNTLAGAKGTTPGVVASEDFKKKMLAADKTLTVFNYGPESYDAVMLIALAAEAAKSDAGTDIAKQLQAVSAGGSKCTTFAACKKLLDAGTDFDYDGISGPIEFDANGDPSEANIGIYQYDETNNFKYLEGKAGKL
jgi:ABC-type branched-subunit amino acid transport system substrate-binding protein